MTCGAQTFADAMQGVSITAHPQGVTVTTETLSSDAND